MTMNFNFTKKSRRKCNVPECFVAIIKEKYPTENTVELAKEMGVKAHQLRTWANSLRVYKDHDFLCKQSSVQAQRKLNTFDNKRCGRIAE